MRRLTTSNMLHLGNYLSMLLFASTVVSVLSVNYKSFGYGCEFSEDLCLFKNYQPSPTLPARTAADKDDDNHMVFCTFEKDVCVFTGKSRTGELFKRVAIEGNYVMEASVTKKSDTSFFLLISPLLEFNGTGCISIKYRNLLDRSRGTHDIFVYGPWNNKIAQKSFSVSKTTGWVKQELEFKSNGPSIKVMIYTFLSHGTVRFDNFTLDAKPCPK